MKFKLFLLTSILISLELTIFAQEMDGALFAENIVSSVENVVENKKTVFTQKSSVMLGVGCNETDGIGHRAYGLAQFSMDDGSWTFDFGIRNAPKFFDFTGNLIFYPLLFNHIRIGLGGLYNLEFYNRELMTHNVMLGGSLELKLDKYFSMRLDGAYFCKFETIYGKNELTTIDHFFTTNACVCVDFPKNFGLDLGFGSCQMFRYTDINTMNCTLDFRYTLREHWRFILEGVVALKDCFTDGVNVSDADLGLMVKYLF